MFKELCTSAATHQIRIGMTRIECPDENRYAERFLQTIREEKIELYKGLDDTRKQITQFLEDVYMTKRIHSVLDYVTPAEFASRYQTSSLSVP